ncbi:CNB_1a_G0004880.mRNA.1.CDS.1 [Saccharomyces cerevisiae]|nr:CNB_1a_G0004880.mRNA.1.CDS.1 [Saccharomyces cerevisiae]CAI7161311.1 CNB_1a_G0004880.mRNA.1.CDS.1 [Saccharomyces cerevisiae]
MIRRKLDNLFLKKANFDEFESALNNKNDLVHCPSITLFESIPTEVRSFYEDEKSGLIKVVKFRTGAMDRKRSFEKIVVSVMVGKNVQKFLTFVEDEPDFQGGPIPSKTSATTTESTNSSTNATTTASTNVRTSATTTASINVRTSATTTESTNSNTSATTTESTDSNTSATTTESTDSNTSATTTASTNSSTNATTTESTNASAKEDANKDGNAEDNRFHPVTDINKESYKRKGVKWFC